LEFYAWFEREFQDDIGEPVFDLYWALAMYRAGDLREARFRLQTAMLQNIYMLPLLYGEPINKLKIWHGSNQEHPEYLDEIEEYLAAPTVEEREWMRAEFQGERFTQLREGYIDTFRQLLDERTIEKRSAILTKWTRFSAGFFE